ncbi:sulfurtransferase-like selenium metabolism protein YedF [Anaeromyxobacter oryzisoli]|uniref:sulfurtransferase-like selenium metabolism protein YedF n=1 Tax=Anaeromyxobacter oryzisoli TaxID=2925408 RepID=UPI001F58470E|nr:sulfurtransferase-like selenium metabolism protein YedF [Anaeromyxobacter sp. SG63]
MSAKDVADARRGGTVVIVNGEGMGRGDDALGAKLLGNFLRTLTTLEAKPDTLVFYNAGVKLLGSGSASLEALRQLEDAGVDLLACVTCLEFFGLTKDLQVGQVSNMREIAQRTLAAASVVTL